MAMRVIRRSRAGLPGRPGFLPRRRFGLAWRIASGSNCFATRASSRLEGGDQERDTFVRKSRGWLLPPRTHVESRRIYSGWSRASRNLRISPSSENGFSRKKIPGSSTPWWTIASLV